MIELLDLSRFCATTPDRANLLLPWSEGDHTYASDGRIIVRVPRIPQVPTNPDAPSLLPHRNCFTDDGDPATPMPALATPEQKPCEHCQGHEDGCEKCDFIGYFTPITRIRFDTKGFADCYLHLINTLPNPQIYPKPRMLPAPMYFTFTGGDGLLMPMKPE